MLSFLFFTGSSCSSTSSTSSARFRAKMAAWLESRCYRDLPSRILAGAAGASVRRSLPPCASARNRAGSPAAPSAEYGGDQSGGGQRAGGRGSGDGCWCVPRARRGCPGSCGRRLAVPSLPSSGI